MAKPTERALKRKPMAVILLTTRREDVPNVPEGAGGHEFEWFEKADSMNAYFNQNDEYHQQDTKDHDDMAYMAVEITDTSTDPMTLGRVVAHPETDETKEWVKSIKADPTKAFQPVKEVKDEEKSTAKVVRPRRKSSAAAAVQKDDSKAKAASLKQRLAAKKDEPKKSETGDPAPAATAKPKPPAKKAETAKVPVSNDTDEEKGFVVKKAATAKS